MRLLINKPGILVYLTLLISFSAGCNPNLLANESPISSVPIDAAIPQSQPKPYQPESQQSYQVQLPAPISSQPPSTTPKPLQLSLKLEHQIGQMLMVGFRGLSTRDQGVKDIIRDIKRFNLGGVILFDYDIPSKSSRRNIQSPKQVKALVEQLQAASPISLFIAIDQEGGKIQRLKKKFGFPSTASAQYLGNKNDLALTHKQASILAKNLAGLGINFNFAPVVDLNINPSNPVIGKLRRSFSADPNIVTQHAQTFIEAHHRYGVLCAIKHFPGHGSSTKDSHWGLVDVTNSWREQELEPFKKLIGKTDAIMTAHVFNRKLDKKYPATLSQNIVNGRLRQQLGYKGVIVSDDMQMEAIAHHYTRQQAIQKTLEAGIDIIVIGNNLKYENNVVSNTVRIIKQLVNEGTITEARIEKSYQRIQQLKNQLLKRQRTSNQKYRLTVNAVPTGSRIRIMNIGPKYFPGIELAPGTYDILVEKPGYIPSQKPVTLRAQDMTISVTLTAQQGQ